MTFEERGRRQSRRGRRRPGGDDRPAAPVGDSIDAYLASEGLGGMRALAKIAAAWPEVVGEPVANHSAPRSLDGKELVVAVDHPSRVTELVFLAPTICERLADLLGYRAVERVKGRVDGRFRLD